MSHHVPVRRRLLFALATSAAWERAVPALPGRGRACQLDRPFGESVSDPAEADRVADDYVALARSLDRAPENAVLSIDLSHIRLDEPGDAARQRRWITLMYSSDRRFTVTGWHYRSAGARTTISSVSSGRSRALQRPSLDG
jgi:hypothetical protein